MALHPGWIFVLALGVAWIVGWRWRWPLPLILLAAAVLAAALAGFGLPLRHLVEGGFGYFNLILALFAGCFFGQALRLSGAADATAQVLANALRQNRAAMVVLAGLLIFLAGMFTGLAGVAVLAMGVFAAPLLAQTGMARHRIAAFLAVMATLGMIAPPVDVPAMVMADGVNMPYAKFAGPMLAVSLPPALLALVLFARPGQGEPPPSQPDGAGVGAAPGLAALVFVIGFWALLRLFPTHIPDPAVPIILVLGAIPALARLKRRSWTTLFEATFTGTPLMLAAVLVTVGIAVQVMTLTGIRGWLVINAMAFPWPWIVPALASLPLFGGVLTSVGTANILGVPFAFAFIHQDMIVNISALTGIAALSEFCPPTAIAAVLSGYLVGETSLRRILAAAWPPLALLLVLSVAMLLLAPRLAPLLVG
ncbi:MAG: TRAP transporter large permease subunit [Rhodospirillales bacterium]|nr:TRAP transporter large permease subunit [Rhodospirillales bacterium]